MASEIVMPRLGWNMETGALGEWLKRDGDRVSAGDFIFTVESDKAVQEVEAFDSGILRIAPNCPPPGEQVPVGTVLGYLLAEGEQPPLGPAAPPAATELGVSAGGEAAAPGASQAARSTAGDQEVRGTTPAISPRARRIAGELGVDWTLLKGSGRTGRIRERDVRQAAEQAHIPARISPLARRVAAELGVNPDALAASMPGRRIEREDVEAAAALRAPAAPAPEIPAGPPTPPAPPQPAAAPVPGTLQPISVVRRTIAARMANSAHTAAPVTLTTEADATELVRLREQLKGDAEGGQPVPGYNDLLARLVSVALIEHPSVNARFEGDGILLASTVNVGLAVDTERGLLVPVLRDVQTKTVRQIARESADLIERTRAGRISPDDLRGGTITITNLGTFEIDAFTPIINLPECAILGVGRILPKPVVVDVAQERIAVRHMVFLSLTFDHRLVDGAPAARFLQRVKQYVERPYLWLVA